MVAIPRAGVVCCGWPRAQLCWRKCSLLSLALQGVGFGGSLSSVLSRRLSIERFGDGCYVLRCVPAATASNVNQSSAREVAEITSHILRSQIETGFRQRIRQTRVRVARDSHICLLREFLQKRIHQIRTERAVESHRQRLHVPYRVPECLSRLRRYHCLAAPAHRRRDHHRQFFAALVEHLTDGDKGCLRVQGVEDRLP